jgi:hypothetical protein
MPWVVKRQGAGGGQEHESSRRARPADPQEERGGTLDRFACAGSGDPRRISEPTRCRGRRALRKPINCRR